MSGQNPSVPRSDRESRSSAPRTWRALAEFQIDIARRWLDRGRSADSEFSKFFFLFAGFNALYFLWGKIHDVRNADDEPAGESRQIEHLLGLFDPQEAQRLLDAGT